MDTHTHAHTHTHTRQLHYSNPRACAPRVNYIHAILIPLARDEFLVAELQSTSENDSSVSQNKHFRASIIVWGMPKSLSTLEIRAKLADIGLASFARGSVLGG